MKNFLLLLILFFSSCTKNDDTIYIKAEVVSIGGGGCYVVKIDNEYYSPTNLPQKYRWYDIEHSETNPNIIFIQYSSQYPLFTRCYNGNEYKYYTNIKIIKILE